MTDTRSAKLLLVSIIALAASILGWKVLRTGAGSAGASFENYNMATTLSVRSFCRCSACSR